VSRLKYRRGSIHPHYFVPIWGTVCVRMDTMSGGVKTLGFSPRGGLSMAGGVIMSVTVEVASVVKELANE